MAAHNMAIRGHVEYTRANAEQTRSPDDQTHLRPSLYDRTLSSFLNSVASLQIVWNRAGWMSAYLTLYMVCMFFISLLLDDDISAFAGEMLGKMVFWTSMCFTLAVYTPAELFRHILTSVAARALTLLSYGLQIIAVGTLYTVLGCAQIVISPTLLLSHLMMPYSPVFLNQFLNHSSLTDPYMDVGTLFEHRKLEP